MEATLTRSSVMLAVAALFSGSTSISPPAAADPAANFLTKLFVSACVPNLSQPTKVREWAEEHHLAPIQSPAALGVFVGPGGNGAAWAVPALVGNYALSIRGTTQACAVWARAANPNDVLSSFKKLVEGVKRPGIQITVDKDTISPSPVGNVHVLVYSVSAVNVPASFVFTMLTAERTGGVFQASLQVAKAGAR